MATELTGARVLAPLFGASLYVWSAVLAITLSGLAVGYFAGGRLSAKGNLEKKLLYILIFAALFIMIMPVAGKFMRVFAFHLSLLSAVSLSALVILFPPLMFMGMVSPLIISLLINEHKGGGKRAGEVYAVSTVGGIIFTFLTGFWLLPSFGIDKLMLVLGGFLMIIPLILLVKMKDTFRSILFFAFATFVAWTVLKNQRNDLSVLYESDGIFGHIEVVDFEHVDETTGLKKHPRYLLVNNIIQSGYDFENDRHIMDYTRVIDSNIIMTSERKKALVLGLGGGIVANIFAKKNYDVTAVELDKRNYEAAKKYFALDKDVDVVIDDARNYINRTNEKYDVIMIDVFKGEDPPFYVLTKESLSKMKNSLLPGGKIIVNTYGYLSLPSGKGNHALIATMKSVGMQIKLVASAMGEEDRNILIYASEKSDTIEFYGEIDEKFSLAEVPILTDNYSPLDHLNAEAGENWRKLYLKNFILRR